MLREELQLLQEPGSYVGEVIKASYAATVLLQQQRELKHAAAVTAHMQVSEIAGSTDRVLKHV
jgi:26S proteasome regulatory subunit T6